MSRKLLVALLISLVAPNILAMPKKFNSLADLNKEDDKPDWREAAKKVAQIADEEFDDDESGFKGEGRRLDEERPAFSSALNGGSEENSDEENEQHALAMLSVDESQPTTRIRIRLGDDGTVLTVVFNLVHTIEDIRTFVKNARPEYVTKDFDLFSTLPPKELIDFEATIKKAGLAQSVIVVKPSDKPKRTFGHDSDGEVESDDSFDDGSSFGD